MRDKKDMEETVCLLAHSHAYMHTQGMYIFINQLHREVFILIYICTSKDILMTSLCVIVEV